MNTTEFIKIMAYLSSAYNKSISKETTTIYYTHLKNEKYLKEAVKTLVAKEKYFPTVARIKEECYLLRYPCIAIDIDTTWELICEMADNAKEKGDLQLFVDTAKEKLDNMSIAIISKMGYYDIYSAWNIDVKGEEYKELFEKQIKFIKNKLKEEMTVHPALETISNENKRIE